MDRSFQLDRTRLPDVRQEAESAGPADLRIGSDDLPVFRFECHSSGRNRLYAGRSPVLCQNLSDAKRDRRNLNLMIQGAGDRTIFDVI